MIKKMDRKQKQALVRAWRLQHQIVKDIQNLAEMSIPMAYGCIRTAESLIDFQMANGIRQTINELQKEGKTQ